MKKFAALLLVAMIYGCASTGVEVNNEQLSQFKEGVTTESEVVAKLGQPNTVSQTPHGKTLIYVYAHAQARPASFIPIVGIFAGGADVRSTSATFNFDKSGVLKSVYSSQSAQGTGTGFAAGQPIQQVDQPRQQE